MVGKFFARDASLTHTAQMIGAVMHYDLNDEGQCDRSSRADRYGGC